MASIVYGLKLDEEFVQIIMEQNKDYSFGSEKVQEWLYRLIVGDEAYNSLSSCDEYFAFYKRVSSFPITFTSSGETSGVVFFLILRSKEAYADYSIVQLKDGFLQVTEEDMKFLTDFAQEHNIRYTSIGWYLLHD